MTPKQARHSAIVRLLMSGEHLTATQIAERVGSTAGTVNYIRRKEGIPLRERITLGLSRDKKNSLPKAACRLWGYHGICGKRGTKE